LDSSSGTVWSRMSSSRGTERMLLLCTLWTLRVGRLSWRHCTYMWCVLGYQSINGTALQRSQSPRKRTTPCSVLVLAVTRKKSCMKRSKYRATDPCTSFDHSNHSFLIQPSLLQRFHFFWLWKKSTLKFRVAGLAVMLLWMKTWKLFQSDLEWLKTWKCFQSECRWTKTFPEWWKLVRVS
jgi:hypothetical protein